ncbi:hypothetical protein L7F22_030286 [Adiantum nelumboides]|nr:hypothetical protein [Adiantum nelumboides]
MPAFVAYFPPASTTAPTISLFDLQVLTYMLQTITSIIQPHRCKHASDQCVHTIFCAYIEVGNTTDSLPSAAVYNKSTQMSDGSSIILHNKMVILIIILSSFIVVLCLVSFTLLGIKIRKRLAHMDVDDALTFLESLPGLPARFSFKELNKATGRFSKKLGRHSYKIHTLRKLNLVPRSFASLFLCLSVLPIFEF